MSNKLYEENDIQNIANAIRNKNGTEDPYKVSQMSTAINSIEVIEQATAEGESLSLTNTKAMPYKDYVVEGKSEQEGTPSPSNPSEIHSVADDVNLWSLNSSYITATGSEYVLRDTIISTISAGTYTLSLNKSINSKVMFAFKNASNQEFDVILDGIEQKTITFTDDKFKTAIYIYGNQACTISNIKLQKGTVATPYSPYNQGTVTIKQRGKNKLPFTNQDFTVNNVRYYVQDGSLYFNGTSTNETITKNINFKNNFNFELEIGTYRISHKTGVSAVYLYNYDDDTNALITLGTDTASQTFTLTQKTKLYIGFYVYKKVFNDINIELMIEQRKYRYRLRTISNTTRLHYPNRTIKKSTKWSKRYNRSRWYTQESRKSCFKWK